MACYDEARQYAMSRVQFDRPIGGFQLVQAKLARMLTEITKAQLLALRLAQLKDAGTAKHYHISMAKMNNVEIALDAARTARDILGGVGILDEHQCFRHMCNLESVKTYGGRTTSICSSSASRSPACRRLRVAGSSGASSVELPTSSRMIPCAAAVRSKN